MSWTVLHLITAQWEAVGTGMVKEGKLCHGHV